MLLDQGSGARTGRASAVPPGAFLAILVAWVLFILLLRYV